MTTDIEIRKDFTPGVLSKNQALFLLKSIWPEAPVEKQVEAAIICNQYQLNPLMRQVYLVPFGKEWVVVLGIGATRLIAQKDGRYSYTDGPRVMAEAEQVTYLGEADPANLWVTTEITDKAGNKYRGFGFWPRGKPVHGADKGNTPRGMAAIRAERDALKKYAPGRLPDNLEVADDTYMPVGNYTAAIEAGRQEFEAQVEVDKDNLFGEVVPDATTLAAAKEEIVALVKKNVPKMQTNLEVRDWLVAQGFVLADLQARPDLALAGLRKGRGW
jgi:hypothetical protein